MGAEKDTAVEKVGVVVEGAEYEGTRSETTEAKTCLCGTMTNRLFKLSLIFLLNHFYNIVYFLLKKILFLKIFNQDFKSKKLIKERSLISQYSVDKGPNDRQVTQYQLRSYDKFYSNFAQFFLSTNGI